ncbi:MAG TPA: PAS domain-containing protein, partial [Steroidobacteraceae bacterium]|nr:PAS domain-containing protein [Steroidobacteraceae bacterium]
MYQVGQVGQVATTVGLERGDRSKAAPGWANRLLIGLVIYVASCSVWMQAGFGGERVRRYVGLLARFPASLIAVIVAVAVARRLAPGASRTAWWYLAVALGLYFVADTIGVSYWLHGRDPFPGIADIFYVAFYFALFPAVAFLIRAAAVKVHWAQLALDAAILVSGFGAFFWFLVIRPAASGTETDVIKNALTQIYLALDCILLLTMGVLLLTGVGNRAGRRVSLLLLVGFATMFLGDILWSIAKITGHYLPGAFQDVLYSACYVPLAAAGREQMRASPGGAALVGSDSLAQSLPYAAMLTAFLVLVYFTRGDIGGPATVMTIIVFGLTLLVMVRQALVLREDALTRERRAARMVEERYASLIANASDVIMIVAADGALRFASPASERTLGLKPEEIAGKNLLDLWGGEDAERLRAFLAEVAATPGGAIGPVELRIERGTDRY